jgi:hypothetical protein
VKAAKVAWSEGLLGQERKGQEKREKRRRKTNLNLINQIIRIYLNSFKS